MPASLARSLTAGEASGRSPSGRGAPVGVGPAAVDLTEAGAGFFSAAGGATGSAFAGFASGSAATALLLTSGVSSVGSVLAAASPATSIFTIGEPTATVSPISAPSQAIWPSTGEGISTVALSVITAAITVSSRTRSPTFTFHSTSSASATPSPTSGILMTCSAIYASITSRSASPTRFGPGK